MKKAQEIRKRIVKGMSNVIMPVLLLGFIIGLVLVAALPLLAAIGLLKWIF